MVRVLGVHVGAQSNVDSAVLSVRAALANARFTDKGGQVLKKRESAILNDYFLFFCQ